ncbi:MAG TPA: hypothetical protein VJ065_02375 [Patescibacteria group bacterium]|nr:hypothetical protein [Patescibacteria group bacterium]
MQNERIRDYFIEDIQEEAWTKDWRLITQAGYQQRGLVVEVTNESFTYEEASRLTELFHRKNVRPPSREAQLDMPY